jgi:hypothetical protein
LRFFKDFSDFENAGTPDFRHPPIIGGIELEQIGIIKYYKNKIIIIVKMKIKF